jgi:hypothetical protein
VAARSGIRRARLIVLVVPLLLGGCAELDPEEARTRADFCFWFDRFLDVLEEEDPPPEEIDQAAQDLIAAGVSFGIRGEAPGIGMEIDAFAAALDNMDLAAVDEFINNTLLYCEDLLVPE